MEAIAEKINCYESYKDSGVEWLGEIPENWELGRLGSILNPISSKNHPNETLLSITREKGVIVRDLENEGENHNYIPDDLTSYKLLKDGQFGMNKMKAWQGSYGVSSYTGIVSPAYYTFEFTKDIEPRFFHLAIRSKLYVSFFGKASDGVRIGQWDLSKDRMKRIPFAIPPLTEQTVIAEFLDDKTTKIDQAIAIKEQQISLLKERKQILIHKAVTRGLDDTVPLKDSGVEWIEEIPEHWECKRLASFSKFSKGGGFSKADLVENGVCAILYGDIYTKYDIYIKKEIRFITKETAKKSVKLDKHDLLFTGSGETKEDIGKCVVFLNDTDAYAGGDVIILRQNENDSLFLSYVMNTEGAKYEKARFSKGEIIVHTYASKLREMFVPIPPLPEQKEISNYIKTGSKKIDATIGLKQQEIEKLKEYKGSLINGVVTGKVRVS